VSQSSPTGQNSGPITSTTSYVDHWDARAKYSEAKAKAILELLEAAGTKFSFLGITTVARWSTRGKDAEEARAAVQGAFGGLDLLSEGESPYDFSLRASRVVGENQFSNIFLNWYQSRSVTVALQVPKGVVPTGFSLNEWDMPLEEEGIELRFDRNNKRAMFEGCRDWTKDALLTMVCDTMKEMPISFDAVVKAIEQSRAPGGHDD